MSKNTVKPILKFVLLFFLSITVIAQNNYTGSEIKFVVISDVHISNDETKDERLLTLINEMNSGKLSAADLLVITGDNVSSYYSKRNEGDELKNNRARKLMGILKNLSKPYLIALGNHDYKIDRDKDSDAPFTFEEIDKIETLWKEQAGVLSYYSYGYDGYKLILLNSMRGRYLERSFDDEQLNWLIDQLKEDKPTFLFFHHPVQTDNFRIWCKPRDLIAQEKEEKFFSTLAKYKEQIKGIFVGHGHMWVNDILYNTIPVYETALLGEGKGLNYYLVETDIVKKKIKVIKYSK